MKDLIAVLWFPALIIALMFVFNPVEDNKTSDIEEIRIEELEEKIIGLEWENCELKKFATSKCKELKNKDKVMYVKQRGKVSNEKN